MTYSIYDNSFVNSNLYTSFKQDNPGFGYLRVRAFSASEALPVSGVKVEISTDYQSNHIIFYQGETDESGLIEKIPLPTPKTNLDNMEIPNQIVYHVDVVYEKENLKTSYSVLMYDGVCSVQNVQVKPATLEVGVVTWQ